MIGLNKDGELVGPPGWKDELREPPSGAQEGIAAVTGTATFETAIDDLTSMSAQARAALKRAGYRTLEEVATLADETLLAIPGFKESSLARLRAWEADPTAPQPTAGRIVPAAQHREARIFALYTSLRANGHPAATAREVAIEEVDALQEKLRGGA